MIDPISSGGSFPDIAAAQQRPRPGFDAAAQALGMRDDDLRQALRGGTTLADLASQKGVSQSDLVSAIAKGLQAAAPADAPANADYTQMAQAIVSGRRPQHAHHHHQHASGGGNSSSDLFSQVASALGMSESDILSQLESGTSFNDLLASKGLTAQSLQGLNVDTTA